MSLMNLMICGVRDIFFLASERRTWTEGRLLNKCEKLKRSPATLLPAALSPLVHYPPSSATICL